MTVPSVLIAGASIAGPALAHCLAHHGAEVTVVERAPALRPGGQAVDARGAAREVIRRMGLDEAVRAARGHRGHRPRRWCGYGENGVDGEESASASARRRVERRG